MGRPADGSKALVIDHLICHYYADCLLWFEMYSLCHVKCENAFSIGQNSFNKGTCSSACTAEHSKYIWNSYLTCIIPSFSTSKRMSLSLCAIIAVRIGWNTYSQRIEEGHWYTNNFHECPCGQYSEPENITCTGGYFSVDNCALIVASTDSFVVCAPLLKLTVLNTRVIIP